MRDCNGAEEALDPLQPAEASDGFQTVCLSSTKSLAVSMHVNYD